MKLRDQKPDINFLVRRNKSAATVSKFGPRIVTTELDLRSFIGQASRDSVWVSYSKELTEVLVKYAATAPCKMGKGVFVHPIELKMVPVLLSLFHRIAFATDGEFIQAAELAEVLQSNHCANLLIGGFVNDANKTITLWRGNLESLTVPFSAFPKSGNGTGPDFTSFSIVDCGQTVKLGDYEAAVDAILYENDVEYRREIAKKRRRRKSERPASQRNQKQNK
jgi:hypothetical protein